MKTTEYSEPEIARFHRHESDQALYPSVTETRRIEKAYDRLKLDVRVLRSTLSETKDEPKRIKEPV